MFIKLKQVGKRETERRIISTYLQRNKKRVASFFPVTETKVWENEKCCGNSSYRASYENTILNQSARVFSLGYFLNNKNCVKLFSNNWKSSY